LLFGNCRYLRNVNIKYGTLTFEKEQKVQGLAFILPFPLKQVIRPSFERFLFTPEVNEYLYLSRYGNPEEPQQIGPCQAPPSTNLLPLNNTPFVSAHISMTCYHFIKPKHKNAYFLISLGYF
jgi:hypothetical protein